MDADDHTILIRLDEKMDAVLRWQLEHRENCHVTHTDHEGRLRGLERWKWKEAGALGMLVLAANWLWDVITRR